MRTRRKMCIRDRYVTVGLALIESAAMAIGFGRQGLMDDFNALNVITVIAALTAGSAFLMWIGERITENGVGNGISIVLTINIISRMPSDLSSLYQQFVKGKAVAVGALAAVILSLIHIFREGTDRGVSVTSFCHSSPRHSRYNRMYAPRTFYCHESQLRCFWLLAQLLLLIDWRSLRGALQSDFRVNTKSVCRTPRVNCCIEKCTKKEKSF